MVRRLRQVTSDYGTLLLTIPKYLVEELHLTANQEVNVELKGKKIVISPLENNADI